MYYSSIGIIALLVHLIINYEHMRPISQAPAARTEKRYRQYLVSILLYYIIDICWGITYEHDLILLCYIATILYFITVTMTVFLWTRFVVFYLEHKNNFSRFMVTGGIAILIFQILILIINLFIPIAFKFNTDTEYQAGHARYVGFFAQVLLNIITMGYTFSITAKTKGKTRSHHCAVGVAGAIMTGFIILQMVFPLMPFYSIGCLLTTCLIHSFVYRDKMVEHAVEMSNAKIVAHKDPLTGIRNKLAYLETLKDLESCIDNGKLTEYGLVVFDVNNLKLTNDTLGHEAGDELLKNACALICRSFEHSPVFRVGGDEFVAILTGEPFRQREYLVNSFEKEIDRNQKNGGVVIASGYDIFDPSRDETYTDVFRRADKKMYARKNQLKNSDADS